MWHSLTGWNQVQVYASLPHPHKLMHLILPSKSVGREKECPGSTPTHPMLALPCCDETPEKKSSEGKRVHWLMVSEVWVCGHLVPSLWACVEAEHHGTHTHCVVE